MTSEVSLDEVDRQILALLQQDGRLPNRQLAEKVGVAASTALARVGRLRRAGVITGFRAHVCPSAVGRRVEALLAVQMRHSRPVIDPFVQDIRALPETRALFHVTGREDFIVHVACVDVPDLRRLVLDEFTARPEVGHVESHLVYSSWPGGPVTPGP